jgi:hypothetical protein
MIGEEQEPDTEHEEGADDIFTQRGDINEEVLSKVTELAKLLRKERRVI